MRAEGIESILSAVRSHGKGCHFWCAKDRVGDRVTSVAAAFPVKKPTGTSIATGFPVKKHIAGYSPDGKNRLLLIIFREYDYGNLLAFERACKCVLERDHGMTVAKGFVDVTQDQCLYLEACVNCFSAHTQARNTHTYTHLLAQVNLLQLVG